MAGGGGALQALHPALDAPRTRPAVNFLPVFAAKENHFAIFAAKTHLFGTPAAGKPKAHAARRATTPVYYSL